MICTHIHLHTFLNIRVVFFKWSTRQTASCRCACSTHLSEFDCKTFVQLPETEPFRGGKNHWSPAEKEKPEHTLAYTYTTTLLFLIFSDYCLLITPLQAVKMTFWIKLFSLKLFWLCMKGRGACTINQSILFSGQRYFNIAFWCYPSDSNNIFPVNFLPVNFRNWWLTWYNL